MNFCITPLREILQVNDTNIQSLPISSKQALGNFLFLLTVSALGYSSFELAAHASEKEWQWSQKMNEEENQSHLSEENIAAFRFLAKPTHENRRKQKTYFHFCFSAECRIYFCMKVYYSSWNVRTDAENTNL